LKFFEGVLGLSELALEGLLDISMQFSVLVKLLETFLELGLEVCRAFFLILEELV
jgi:hypothetical protein